MSSIEAGEAPKSWAIAARKAARQLEENQKIIERARSTGLAGEKTLKTRGYRSGSSEGEHLPRRKVYQPTYKTPKVWFNDIDKESEPDPQE